MLEAFILCLWFMPILYFQSRGNHTHNKPKLSLSNSFNSLFPPLWSGHNWSHHSYNVIHLINLSESAAVVVRMVVVLLCQQHCWSVLFWCSPQVQVQVHSLWGGCTAEHSHGLNLQQYSHLTILRRSHTAAYNFWITSEHLSS